MHPIDVCIIEDEQPAALALHQDVLTYCKGIGQVFIANSLEDGLELLRTKKPALLFLDVRLGGTVGLDLFEQIKDPFFETILVTAYDNFAIQAIKYNVLDYLLKPVNKDQLIAAFQKATHKLETKSRSIKKTDKIAISFQDKILVIECDQILRCEAQSNYCWIYTHNSEKVLASITLGVIQEYLNLDNFIRVHQSHLVAKNAIKSYHYSDGGKIEMINGTIIPVSRTHKKNVMNYLKKLLVR